MSLVRNGESLKVSEQKQDKISTCLWKEVLAVGDALAGTNISPSDIRRSEHLAWRGEMRGLSRRANKQTSHLQDAKNQGPSPVRDNHRLHSSYVKRKNGRRTRYTRDITVF